MTVGQTVKIAPVIDEIVTETRAETIEEVLAVVDERMINYSPYTVERYLLDRLRQDIAALSPTKTEDDHVEP